MTFFFTIMSSYSIYELSCNGEKFYGTCVSNEVDYILDYVRERYENGDTVNITYLGDTYGIDKLQVRIVEEITVGGRDEYKKVKNRRDWYIRNNPCINKQRVNENAKILRGKKKNGEVVEKRQYTTNVFYDKLQSSKKPTLQLDDDDIVEDLMSSDIVEVVVVEKKKGHRNKEREKAYYEKNKEKILERNRKYKEQFKSTKL